MTPNSGRLLQLLATCRNCVIKWCAGYWDQGCEVGNQISDSGSSSRHLNFLAPALAPKSKRFWPLLLVQNDLLHWKLKNIVLFVQFACPTNYAYEPESKVQSLAPPSKSFWHRLHPSKIACDPAPGYGSTALTETKEQERNEVRWRSGQEASLSPPWCLRKQMYCIEDKIPIQNTCLYDRFVGSWRTWLNMLGPRCSNPSVLGNCFCTYLRMQLTNDRVNFREKCLWLFVD